jgi:protein TonB
MSMEISNGEGAIHPIGGGGGKRGMPRWMWIAVLIAILLHLGLVVVLSRLGVIRTPLTPEPKIPIITVEPLPLPPPPPLPPQPHPNNTLKVYSPPTPPDKVETTPIPTTTQNPPTTGVDRVVSNPPQTPPVTSPPAPPAPPPVITQPRWVSQPSAADMAKFYPPQAIDAEMQGRAVIRCKVTISGTLTGCIVVSETPPGYGFGRAAVRLSPYFRMTPRTEDGRAVDGALVDVAIGFRF